MEKKNTFSERVIKLARSIPNGRVITYGGLARSAGAGPMASQSISGILWKAEQRGEGPFPWHRIVYAGGKVWLNDECRKKRLALYKKEGIEIDEKDRIVNFEDVVL